MNLIKKNQTNNNEHMFFYALETQTDAKKA